LARLFGGVGSPLLLLVKEPPKMVLRRMMGPSLETGALLNAALSGNSRTIAIECRWWRYKKNVMKKAGAEFGFRIWRDSGHPSCHGSRGRPECWSRAGESKRVESAKMKIRPPAA